jgi:zinc transport system permease protein
MSYLFGNILMVPQQDIWLMAFLDLVVLAMVWLFYHQFLAVSFDEEFARLRGVPVTGIYLLLLCMVAVTVVLLIQVVGLILVIALLTLPAAIAAQYFYSLGKMMLAASVLGMLFTTAGLVISYAADLPSGASIILTAGLAYLISTIGNQLLQRRRQTQQAS